MSRGWPYPLPLILSMAKYYYTYEGKTLGPVSPKEVLDLILDDVLSMDSSVMESSSPQWLKIRDIPELMRYLHESEVQITDWAEDKGFASIDGENVPLFFHIPVSRLVWLSLITFGFYEIYWIYRNWRFLRFHRKGRTAAYFGRDLRNPVDLVGVFSQISTDQELGGRYNGRDFTLNGWLWIVALLTQVARSILGFTPFLSVWVDFALTFGLLALSILCLVPVQKHINEGNAKAGKPLSRPTFGHYASIVVGLLVWLLVLLSLIPRLVRLFT